MNESFSMILDRDGHSSSLVRSVLISIDSKTSVSTETVTSYGLFQTFILLLAFNLPASQNNITLKYDSLFPMVNSQSE